MFEHRCENDVCFLELVAPLLIDTAPLSAAKGALVGKLASENFNFRHITVSVNLVGTGVRDCTKTPTPSCYGSGYLEYTLRPTAPCGRSTAFTCTMPPSRAERSSRHSATPLSVVGAEFIALLDTPPTPPARRRVLRDE